MGMAKKLIQKKKLLVLLILAIIVGSTIFYHTHKELPRGLSYEGEEIGRAHV